MESGNGGNGGNIGGRFGRDGMRFGLNGKGMGWNMVHDMKAVMKFTIICNLRKDVLVDKTKKEY